jgi:tRNA threonylcarbamoyladenosine biosynthesis protein TsaE
LGSPPAASFPPGTPDFSRAFRTRSPAETEDLARRLGSLLSGGEVIALVGELGSGKTTFTRGLAVGLGLADARLVSSPTYVLEQVYPGRIPIHHYDLYRLSAGELQALGFEERLEGSGVVVVEWADKAAGILPAARLLVEIQFPGGGDARARARAVRICGPAVPWAEKLRLL